MSAVHSCWSLAWLPLLLNVSAWLDLLSCLCSPSSSLLLLLLLFLLCSYLSSCLSLCYLDLLLEGSVCHLIALLSFLALVSDYMLLVSLLSIMLFSDFLLFSSCATLVQTPLRFPCLSWSSSSSSSNDCFCLRIFVCFLSFSLVC